MRFLKATRAGGAPESVAVAARLNAVTERGKIEVLEYQDMQRAQFQAQRFWSPDEVEGGHE
jgi:hypothetical protein